MEQVTRCKDHLDKQQRGEAGSWCRSGSALKTHLIKRGYQHRFVKDVIEKVCQITRSKSPRNIYEQENDRIPFVVTFNPALPNIRRIIFNNLNVLRSSQRCKAAFPSPPFISYRRCNNLRDIRVRATHRRPSPQKHLELSAETAVGAKHYRGNHVLHLFLY